MAVSDQKRWQHTFEKIASTAFLVLGTVADPEQTFDLPTKMLKMFSPRGVVCGFVCMRKAACDAVSSAFFDRVTRGASQALLMIDILALSEAKKYALVGIMFAECASRD
ncbi:MULTISPECIES: hypothetical protein [Thiorhodovibrio]|uniref:hypothetical protein n=1 Tax=Thiorhodovibrio TaxID=61593 RepID=UPI00191133A7|nr:MULTISPECIES: hypothetical protein [Thiorhodovibrio]MBK5969348.1 hypothetical protein [Thiorhodovibrio winogradskyi]